MDFKTSVEISILMKNIKVLDKNDISNYIIASYDIESVIVLTEISHLLLKI